MLLRPSPVAGRGEALPPLPAFIRLPQGEISYAARADYSPHPLGRSRRSGAQKAGLAYQRKVEDWLTLARPSSSLDIGPWFFYLDRSGKRQYCQPDALLDSPSQVWVVEIKLRWTSDAWWQLRRLYLPVLGVALPSRVLIPVVICRSYDPSFRIPEEVKLLDDLSQADPARFNVLIWKPQ